MYIYPVIWLTSLQPRTTTGDVGEILGLEADSQERILETSLVQKGGFIKARGQDLWAERAALGS